MVQDQDADPDRARDAQPNGRAYVSNLRGPRPRIPTGKHDQTGGLQSSPTRLVESKK